MYPDIVVAGLGILIDFGKVSLRIGAADDFLRQVFFSHHFRRLFKMSRNGKDLRQLTRESGRGPIFMRGSTRFRFVFRPADCHFRITGLALPTSLLESL